MSEQPQQNAGDKIIIGDIQNSKAIAVGAGATAIYNKGLSTEAVAALVVELQRIDQPEVWDGRFPYLGLTAFQESDSQFFFGREGLVDDLLERVKTARFIVIAGPSGSGKSSVARAGLFHALREGRLEKSNRWLLVTMKPKGDPIEQLALAMARLAKSPSAGAYLRQNGKSNPLALHEQIETLLGDDDRQRCVLLIDQFEETFTQTKKEDRAAFINLLTEAAQVKNGRIIILLSLRADFVSHCARYPALRTLMSQEFQLVGGMAPPDLTKAITLPALEVGAKIDPKLVSRIMTDMKGEPGALPLMSFALRDLFEAEKTEKGKSMDLTLTKYLGRGGIESALERHANKVFDSFSDEQQDLARAIFSKLIEVGQGRADTRRTAVFSELIPAGTDRKEVTAVVNALAQEGVRLITTSGDENATDGGTVTIAHEKLIDAWPWLRQLVDENRSMIILQNQINDDAQKWAKEKDDGFLYRGGRLIQVEEQIKVTTPDLNELSQQFIQTSLDQWQKELREKEEEQRHKLEMVENLVASQTEAANRLRGMVIAMGGGLLLMLLIVGILLKPIIQNQWAKSQARGEMVAISGGEILFGTQNPEYIDYGFIPQQLISVDDFQIAKYEVSNKEYNLCVAYGDCVAPLDSEFLQKDQSHPVVYVSVLQANIYCQWLGLRLPTEVEWERAARGQHGQDWPWGNKPPASTLTNMPIDGSISDGIHPIYDYPDGSSKNDNIYNLVGNVWEWTSSYDEYEGDDYSERHWDGIEAYDNDNWVTQRGGGWVTEIGDISEFNPASGLQVDEETGIRCANSIK